MRIIAVESVDRKAVKDFLELPFQIYQDSSQWVPPFAHEARRQLHRGKNPYFDHSEALFLLAYNDVDQPIGRLAILDNQNYNEFHLAKTAFFFLFESQNQLEIAQALHAPALQERVRSHTSRVRFVSGFSSRILQHHGAGRPPHG